MAPWESRPALKTTVTPPKKNVFELRSSVSMIVCVITHEQYVCDCVCTVVPYLLVKQIICEIALSNPALMCFSHFQQQKCVVFQSGSFLPVEPAAFRTAKRLSFLPTHTNEHVQTLHLDVHKRQHTH